MARFIRNTLKAAIYGLSITCTGALVATIEWSELDDFARTLKVVTILLVATPGIFLLCQFLRRYEHAQRAKELHRLVHSMNRCGFTHLLPPDISGNNPQVMRVIIRTRECPNLGFVAELERVHWHDSDGATFIVTSEGVLQVDGRPVAGTQLAELTTLVQESSPRKPAPVR
jgi:hypothetical protein